MFGKGLVGFLLVSHLLGLVASLDARHLNSLLFKSFISSVYGEELLSLTDVLCVYRIEITFAEREVIDSVQQVGFAHAVVA